MSSSTPSAVPVLPWNEDLPSPRGAPRARLLPVLGIPRARLGFRKLHPVAGWHDGPASPDGAARRGLGSRRSRAHGDGAGVQCDPPNHQVKRSTPGFSRARAGGRKSGWRRRTAANHRRVEPIGTAYMPGQFRAHRRFVVPNLLVPNIAGPRLMRPE